MEIEEREVRSIVTGMLQEQGLYNFIKIFEKEHNIFRGTHSKIENYPSIKHAETHHGNGEDQVDHDLLKNYLPKEHIDWTNTSEDFKTTGDVRLPSLNKGGVLYVGDGGLILEDYENLYWDAVNKNLAIGFVEQFGGGKGLLGLARAETVPTSNPVDSILSYAADSLLEVLTDGGMEIWTSSTNLTNWVEQDTPTLGEIHQENSEIHSGAYSCRMWTLSGGSWVALYQDFTLTPSALYKLSTWYKRPVAAGSNLRLYVTTGLTNDIYLQANGTWSASLYYFTLSTTDAWTKFEKQFNAHASYSTYRIRFYKDHSSGGASSFYVDDVSVLETGNIIPYIRTPNGTVIGFNQSLMTSNDVTFRAIMGKSFGIGANILDATEWAFLDGQDQSVKTTSSPTFANKLLSAQHSDALAGTVVRGDVIIGNSTPKWARLGKGAAGTYLGCDGTDVAWSTFAHNLLSASHGDTLAASVVRGDILVGNSTPKWSRLAKGVAGKYIRSDGTDPSWQSVLDADLPSTIVRTSRVIQTGTGLTGGGDLSADRIFSLSHLGIESLTDPNADRIMFWDETDNAVKWLVPSTGLQIVGTNFSTKDSEIDHDALSNFVAAEHLSLPNTIASVLSDHNLAAHTALGLFDASSDVDHGGVQGLGDDDHSQYHNDARGDERYFTKTEIEKGAFELDANKDFQPVEGEFVDEFFEIDNNGDIMPEALLFEVDDSGNIMPCN